MSCLKEPKLKFKYALGIGDIIACVLHSKIISPLTKLITKKDKPCASCSLRIQALNILFPLPLWRCFFKSEFEKNTALALELKECGYNVTFIDNKLKAIKPNTPQLSDNTSLSNFTAKVSDVENNFPMYIEKDNQKFFLYKKNQMQDLNIQFITLLYKRR